jgi:hypothetical protein
MKNPKKVEVQTCVHAHTLKEITALVSLCKLGQNHAASLLKKADSNTSNGIFLTKFKARVERNFFDYSDSTRYYAEPDVVKYDEDS